jgi:hypothetical protein
VSELREGELRQRIFDFEQKQRTVDADRTWDAHGGKHERTLFAGRLTRRSVDFSGRD